MEGSSTGLSLSPHSAEVVVYFPLMGCSLKHSGSVSGRSVTQKPVINNSDINSVNSEYAELIKVLGLRGNTNAQTHLLTHC